MTNGVEPLILAVGTGATGDYLCSRTGVQRQKSGEERQPFFGNGTVVGAMGDE